jgi:hypothetical protein
MHILGNLIIGCDLDVIILVTYEPLEGVLVVVVGPCPVDRYTWGIISSDLHGVESPQMDVVTLARGKKILEICTRKKEGRFPWRHPGRPRLREILLFHLDVDL